jgi:glycosyltransferase involved in cell wall biosynthesis
MLIYYNDFFYLPLLNESGVECVYLNKAKKKLFRIPIIIKYIFKYKPDTIVAFLNTPSIIACLAKLLLHSFRLIVSERNTNQTISIKDKIKFFLYKYANYVVPNSYSQTEFIKYNFSKLQDKIVTITNFTDTNYFCPIQNKVNNNLLKIVCVGRVCEQKNVK